MSLFAPLSELSYVMKHRDFAVNAIRLFKKLPREGLVVEPICRECSWVFICLCHPLLFTFLSVQLQMIECLFCQTVEVHHLVSGN